MFSYVRGHPQILIADHLPMVFHLMVLDEVHGLLQIANL